MNLFMLERINKGLSRIDASKELGISIFHLRNIENNQRNPSTKLLVNMSILYNCTIEKLLKNFTNELLKTGN